MPAVSRQWLTEARTERDRLLHKAEGLLVHLAHYHYSMRNPVGMNLRAELTKTQDEAAGLGLAILEATQQNAYRRIA